MKERLRRYVREHPQTVLLTWIDGSKRSYSADKAVRLCSIPHTAGCIMEAQAEDQQLAAMLNGLIDSAE